MSIEISEETFRCDVLSSSTPALAVFFLEWSAPCRMLAPAIEELSDDLSAKIRIVKLNAESNPRITDEYGLTEFPAMLIFKDGQVLASRSGAIPKQKLREWIEQSV